MTPQDFITKWQQVDLSERSAAQQHFLDLCDLLGQPKPAAADPEGAWYTFERGVQKTGGGDGWADVWMRGRFAWEYKRKHKNLVEAYQQLCLYREDLENPPLLVVCDLDRFEVHTNFTGTAKKVYAFDLAALADPANLDVLRNLFTDPEALRPGQTTEAITQEVAERFGKIANGMRERGVPAEDAAHFLMKLMFCMFAEDIELLPGKLFSKLLAGVKKDPAIFARRLRILFEAMATGGDFGADPILHFNGGLFADADVVELRPAEIEELVDVCRQDWSNVEPSIFGTLFERTLDPAKRSQIGAHYTSKQDILTLLEPVVMAPLRREWQQVKAQCDELWEKIKETARTVGAARVSKRGSKPLQAHDKRLHDFLGRLGDVTVLDPACGSGNFLYVAINLLLDLEKEVIAYASSHGVSWFPHVRPTQLAGIEINPYAQQLAQVVIWIGYLQWMHHNGFAPPRDPVLEPIESIRRMDAILDLSEPANPKEPEWPAAEFIVGNPPFLGGSKIWEELGTDYKEKLWKVFDGRVPGFSDVCCYWFEKARRHIEESKCKRAGLLATQGIRGGANREVLKRIKQTGDIFFAESDRDWILDGANVHISMVGFDDGSDTSRILDGKPVERINPNLTAIADVSEVKLLPENANLSFGGTKKSGDFNVSEEQALNWLRLPNPHGKPNSDILRRWLNGTAIVKRPDNQWIIDTVEMSHDEFALYEKPFEHVAAFVKPQRDKNKRGHRRTYWWLHAETCPGMRVALAPLSRFLVTPRVSKYRIFIWMDNVVLGDDGIYVFARSDDYFFGVLHSRLHEVWARAQGTQVRERESGFRYTPTTCFETFPFPSASEPRASASGQAPLPHGRGSDHAMTEEQKAAIAAAAKELDQLRTAWLNPPEWTRQEVLEFPGSTTGPWARYVTSPPNPLPESGRGPGGEVLPESGRGPGGEVFPGSGRGRGGEVGIVRYPRLVPKDDDCAKLLAQRTLTKLYNERPTWLDLAHKKLDEAVFAAYGWDPAMTDEQILEKLLELNLGREAAK